MTGPAFDSTKLDRLHRRFQAAQMRFAGLQGQARELQAQKAKLTKSISLAMARIELAPMAAEAFTYLTDKAHRRAVGDFEDLLSAFVDDVIPGAGRIRMEPGTDRGLPSLEIKLLNGGAEESIFEGNGGGLTNVVVAGLGFAALSRTSNRQFMVLDEPDCWLKAVNVPAFTKVIAEVSNPTVDADGVISEGVQTLMVSHNDISLMDEGAHIQDLRVEKNVEAFAAKLGVDVVYTGTPCDCAYVVWVDNGRGKPHVEVVYRDDPEADDEQNALTKGYPYLEAIGGARAWTGEAQPGVRWVEVSNLRSHVHTRLDLSSGLNVLAGSVNGGKSTLYFTALRAMAYGKSDDTMIRHGAKELVIRIGLENDVVLEMVRKRRGTPKVQFRRYERGVLVNEGPQEAKGTGVPGFVADILKIAKVDELDIQLRHQKEPVFLLNESGSRQAKLLSVGRESGLLEEVIARQKKQLTDDRANKKREEVELNDVNRTLTVLEPLAGMASLVEIIGGLFEEAQRTGAVAAQARALVARMAPLEDKVKLLGLVGDELRAAPQVPTLLDVKQLRSLTDRLTSTEQAAQVPDMPGAPVAPDLVRIEPLASLISRIDRTRLQASMPDMPSAPAFPTLVEVRQLLGVISRIEDGAGADVVLAAIPSPPTAPGLIDTLALRETGVKLSTCGAAVKSAEQEDNAAAADSKAAETALHDYQHELGVCPVCSKAFDEARNEI